MRSENKKTTVTKAKLLTGEVITVGATSENEFAYDPKEWPGLEYVGKGRYLYENGTVDEQRIHHFWVEKKQYSINTLNRGDKFLIYIKRAEDGSGNQMGPGILGNRDFLSWVVSSGSIDNTSAVNAIHLDGSGIKLPIHASDIVYIEEGNTGIGVIKSIMSKNAVTYGGFHMKNYVDEFNEVPLKEGDYVTPGIDYSKQNLALGLRNSHKVLNSGDLIFESWTPGEAYVTVKSVGLNRTAVLAVNCVFLKR